jgi:hypothetical protein
VRPARPAQLAILAQHLQYPAQRVLPAKQGLQEFKATQAQPEILGLQANKVFRVFKEYKALPARPVQPVLPVLLEMLAQLEVQVQQATRVQLEIRVQLVLQVLQVQLVQMVNHLLITNIELTRAKLQELLLPESFFGITQRKHLQLKLYLAI